MMFVILLWPPTLLYGHLLQTPVGALDWNFFFTDLLLLRLHTLNQLNELQYSDPKAYWDLIDALNESLITYQNHL